jgi:hypothetical protein
MQPLHSKTSSGSDEWHRRPGFSQGSGGFETITVEARPKNEYRCLLSVVVGILMMLVDSGGSDSDSDWVPKSKRSRPTGRCKQRPCKRIHGFSGQASQMITTATPNTHQFNTLLSCRHRQSCRRHFQSPTEPTAIRVCWCSLQSSSMVWCHVKQCLWW